MAKFEVCCHKFADLSEAGCGVSILNDSKYGFATCGNMMRLSLLRAPKAPDAHADMGRHRIRWAIMPHDGPLTWQTVRTAYNFNNPMSLYALQPSSGPEEALLSSIRLSGSQSMILDCIKRGEDDEDVVSHDSEYVTRRTGRSIILRIYESMGGKSRGLIETTLPVKTITKCNLLEDDGEECKMYGKSICEVELRAFEVATFRLQL
jgi:alpha-mannosidase